MTGSGWILGAGLALLVAAGAADLLAGRWLAGQRASRERPGSVAGGRCGPAWPAGLPYLAGAAAAAVLTAAGGLALAGEPARLAAGLPVPALRGPASWPLGRVLAGPGPAGAALAADRLSGLFLVIAFGVAVPASLAFAGWAARGGAGGRRGLGAGYALTLLAVAVVLTARDAFTFLFGWELMTGGFWLLAGFERHRLGRPSGALVTLSFGKVSGAALLAGLLLLATRAGSLSLAAFAGVPGGAARAAAQVLLVAGFAAKAGLAPFHVWLPRGYAAAPGPARAIMAGVAVNVGFYGLWRTLALLGAPPAWLDGLLLALGGLTALIGIAHAAVQPGLQRVIAYSSVENAGLILVGYGVALVGLTVRDERLAAAGLLAATLQVIAHAMAKALLFTASTAIGTTAPGAPAAPGGRDGDGGPEAPGDDDLDALRGIARRLPWSGTALAIGSMTLAGLPPTAGFASEWFLIEALMQQFRVPGLGLRLALAITGAAVALTAGFAGVTFARLTGLVVLGPAGPAASGLPAGRLAGREHGWPGRAAIVALSVGCLATAALLPLVIRVVAAGLVPVVPSAVTMGALRSPWVVQPVYGGFSILSPTWLWVMMPLLGLAAIGLAWLAAGRRLLRIRRVPAWRSATAGVDGADCYTATGFANPTRHVLAAVLRSTSSVRPLPGNEEPEPGRPRAAAAPVPAARDARLGYTADVIEIVEEYLYRPATRPVLAAARAATRLQSGRLGSYLAYMLVTLVALISLVSALG